MKGIKLVTLIGLLCSGNTYVMDGDSYNDATSDNSLDEILYAISMDKSSDRSYSFGNDFEEIHIKNGRDLAKYIYQKRREFVKNSDSRDKKEHKKMFLQNLQLHASDELSPEGSESGHLVFGNSELIKIGSKALVDLLVQFDVQENIQRPGGEEFYYSFQQGLDQIKKSNPVMYQDCARDIMKKMFGKHSNVVKELKSRKKSVQISQVLTSGRMLPSNSAGKVFTASAKLIPTSARTKPSSSIQMVPEQDEEDDEDHKIDMSVPLQLLTQMLQNNTASKSSENQATSLINMFHSLVEDQKNQQLADLFSKQKEHLQILQSMPHELMSDIFNRTQKVEQGNDTNWKTMLAGFIVSTLINSGLNYLLTGSFCSGGNNTGV